MNKLIKILTNPFLILAGCAAGILTALYNPELAERIKPIGSIYLSILKMCVLPIIISAIVSSIGKLISSSKQTPYIKKMLLLFLGFIIISCLAGIICSVGTAKVLGFDNNLRSTVGNLMLNNDADAKNNDMSFQSVVHVIDSTVPPVVDNHSGLLSFVEDLVPANIFYSLSSERTLQAVFFFLLFSVMLKYVSSDHRQQVIGIFEAIFAVMQQLISAVLCFLPFGLWALLANQFTEINPELLLTLGSFVLMIWISSAVILIISMIHLYYTTGHGFFSQISILKAPILIALSTRSSFPTLPTALAALEDDMHLDKEKTNLSVSLGHTLCKYGKTMVFCIGSVFSLYLYQIEIDISNLAIIFTISILAGMAASGAPSIISRTMIALVLNPLGIPSEAIIVIMLAIDPIVDPVITLVSTYPNYAVAAALSKTDADSTGNITPTTNTTVLQ